MQLYRNRALKSKMRKLHIKRIPGSLLEPANSLIHTHITSAKSPVLETIGEIVCLIASGVVGWIAYVVF